MSKRPYLDDLPEQFAQLADVTLIAEGVELPAHQAILAANSPFFWRYFPVILGRQQRHVKG